MNRMLAAWINNPLLNIDKAVELQKLRREVRLRIIPGRLKDGELTCSQPVVGRWINDCDYPFLTETLALTNDVFKQEFRGIQLSHEERKMLATILDKHTRECARCGSRRAEDTGRQPVRNASSPIGPERNRRPASRRLDA
jgi:hypothetical protein